MLDHYGAQESTMQRRKFVCVLYEGARRGVLNNMTETCVVSSKDSIMGNKGGKTPKQYDEEVRNTYATK